jgi:protein tyrosine/serine phosphatase
LPARDTAATRNVMSVVLDRLYHLHWVTPDVARCAQPYLGFYAAFLRPHRFRSLINLRGENADFRWWRTEKRTAEALGIVHFDARLSSRNIPSRSGLVILFDALERSETPLLIKCSGGQDRTSLAAALLLLHRRGPAALSEAEAQFAFWPYLHRPKHYQRWLKEFPAYAVSEAQGTPLNVWARDHYDAKAFAAFLNAKGLENAFRAFQAEEPG